MNGFYAKITWERKKCKETITAWNKRLTKKCLINFLRRVDYTTVKEEFEQIASVGNDIFTGSYEARNLNRGNFILYLTSEVYCDFEAAVQEAMDDLNPEILDAVMDVTENTPDGDEITEKYWDTQRTLLKEFLEQLYDEVISTWR